MKSKIPTVVLNAASAIIVFAAAGPVPVRADTLMTSGGPLQAASDSLPAKIIKIYVNGNRVTRADFIRLYIGLDTGMTYDSVLAAAGKRRLLNTNLFSKVDIVPIRKQDGVNVYIIITELFYLYPEGGGDYIVGKYGDTTYPVWYRLRLGLSIQNFRGRFETFSIRTSVWEDRSLSVSWSKPFVPSPYFLGVGAGVRDYPDLNSPWRRFVTNGRISGGRTMYGNSRMSISFVPTYSRINSRNEDTIITKFKEVYSAIGWSTDRRDRSYDPLKGWWVYTDALTNALCTDYDPYMQVDSDVRLYHRGFFGEDKFAGRLQTAIRSNDGGIYKGLYIGGDGSIRGFYQSQIGIPSARNNFATMNNYAVGSLEYRFPIWTMPCFDLWLLSDYSDMLKDFYARLDGALFADAGRIWHDLPHPCTENDNGAGFGTGLRAMLPTLRRSVCVDVAWGGYPHASPLHIHFLPGPMYYLYLDMYY